MAELFLQSRAQTRRIKPFFPGYADYRFDDRRVLSGIVYVTRCSLQWHDARRGYGPHKTLYNQLCAGAAFVFSNSSSRP